MNSQHVVVMGAGFGGLNLARQLRDAPVQIALIGRQNHHLFQSCQRSMEIHVYASPYRPPSIRTGART